jgi:hypothetical protein
VQVNMFTTLKRTVEHAQAGAAHHCRYSRPATGQRQSNPSESAVPAGMPERDGLGMARER